MPDGTMFNDGALGGDALDDGAFDDAVLDGDAFDDVTAAPRRWRVARHRMIAKLAGAAFCLIVVLFERGDTGRVVVAGAIALGLVVLAGRDLIAPVRVAADLHGVTVVTGYAGHRRLAWDEIERVRVDSRPRFGRRTEVVEIDAGDWLFLFAESELGEPSRAVVARLRALRAAATDRA
jgi:hypothetical protein